jgi:hypothetical protein
LRRLHSVEDWTISKNHQYCGKIESDRGEM